MYPQLRLLWFRRLALAGAVLAAAVVVLGAWVRLTDAGLGCPDWPGCYGHVYPNAGHAEAQSGLGFAKALHEMIHRYFATTLGAVIVVLLAWAVRFRKDRDQPLIPVALLFIVVCLQGALGALTVTLLLKPLIVTAHLLGGLTTLGLLFWLSLNPETRQLTEREAALRKYALVGLAALILQIALGGWTSTNYAAVACPDFPTCQHSFWPQMDYRDAFVLWRGLGIDYEGGVLANPARVAIHFTHRVGAMVAGSILIALGLLAATSARSAASRKLRRAGRLLVVAVALQISIGVATVHWGVPLPLATLHNAGAAFLVVCMVWLLRALWPAPAIGVVPLHRADSSR
ncbi:MAG TPA: COX15/CtaA family protein [Steroidobacteraceae bacterium]|jgi:cytochrome c oxidase assembly protein subunit 15|nr:COX15/CtaA family protein [Steroidobacteraceae bacterium]